MPEAVAVEGVAIVPQALLSRRQLRLVVAGVKVKAPTWTVDTPATEQLATLPGPELLWMYTTALPFSALLEKLHAPVVGQKVVDCRNAEELYRVWLASTGSILRMSTSPPETT